MDRRRYDQSHLMAIFPSYIAIQVCDADKAYRLHFLLYIHFLNGAPLLPLKIWRSKQNMTAASKKDRVALRAKLIALFQDHNREFDGRILL